MGKLDDLVVSYIEDRLLTLERLADLLDDVLVRQDAHVERMKERIAVLRGQAAEAEAKLSRLYEAIEMGLADVNDPNLKGRLTELARIRDAALADADRIETRAGADDSRLTLERLAHLSAEARKKMRSRDGGFRRHYVQALAQRVEVGNDEVRIKGTKPKLIQALAAAGRVETPGSRVPSFISTNEDGDYELAILHTRVST